MTDAALALLRELATGTGIRRLTSIADVTRAKPLMQHGYSVRLGTDQLQITPTGRAFLAGLDYLMNRL